MNAMQKADAEVARIMAMSDEEIISSSSHDDKAWALTITQKWLDAKIADDPDIECEAGILHLEA